eukprot:m.190622 g.190622  ORF g.190622 m.190622 type:complete len:900 (-) comp15642_c0_seq3:3732-6431(-)
MDHDDSDSEAIGSPRASHNTSMLSADGDNVQFQGSLLHKQNNKTWRRQYVMLRKDGTLEWYETDTHADVPSQEDPTGTFLLTPSCDITENASKCKFTILCGHTRLSFRALSIEILENWLQALFIHLGSAERGENNRRKGSRGPMLSNVLRRLSRRHSSVSGIESKRQSPLERFHKSVDVLLASLKELPGAVDIDEQFDRVLDNTDDLRQATTRITQQMHIWNCHSEISASLARMAQEVDKTNTELSTLTSLMSEFEELIQSLSTMISAIGKAKNSTVHINSSVSSTRQSGEQASSEGVSAAKGPVTEGKDCKSLMVDGEESDDSSTERSTSWYSEQLWPEEVRASFHIYDYPRGDSKLLSSSSVEGAKQESAPKLDINEDTGEEATSSIQSEDIALFSDLMLQSKPLNLESIPEDARASAVYLLRDKGEKGDESEDDATIGDVVAEDPVEVDLTLNLDQEKTQNYDPTQIAKDRVDIFYQEGKKGNRTFARIEAGSIEAIMDQIVSDENQDPDLHNCFITTHNTFAPTDNIVQRLLDLRERFADGEGEGSGTNKGKISSILGRKHDRICTVLLEILETLPRMHSFYVDSKLLERLRVASYMLLTRGRLPLSIRLRRAMRLRLEFSNEQKNITKTPTPELPPCARAVSIMPTLVTDVASTALAVEITRMDMIFYKKIHAYEILMWRSSQDRATSPNVYNMIDRFNQMSLWVASLILNEMNTKNRIRAYKKLVRTCKKLKDIRNFNGLMAFLSALNSAAIRRLSQTIEGAGSKTKATLEKLSLLMDSHKSFALYRAALRESAPPAIPFLGLFLTDITFVELGNRDLVPQEDSSLQIFNCEKRFRLFSILDAFQYYKDADYGYQPNPQMQELIGDFEHHSQDSLFGLSLHLEPRAPPSDQKV